MDTNRKTSPELRGLYFARHSCSTCRRRARVELVYRDRVEARFCVACLNQRRRNIVAMLRRAVRRLA